jgi:hypothetical protein
MKTNIPIKLPTIKTPVTGAYTSMAFVIASTQGTAAIVAASGYAKALK